LSNINVLSENYPRDVIREPIFEQSVKKLTYVKLT
jgi:hypothetical protein